MSLFVNTFSVRVMVVTTNVSLAKNKKLKLISLSINAQMWGSECDTLDGLHLPQEGNPEIDSHGSLNISRHLTGVDLWACLLRKSFGIEFLPSILFHIKKRKRLQSPEEHRNRARRAHKWWNENVPPKDLNYINPFLGRKWPNSSIWQNI